MICALTAQPIAHIASPAEASGFRHERFERFASSITVSTSWGSESPRVRDGCLVAAGGLAALAVVVRERAARTGGRPPDYAACVIERALLRRRGAGQCRKRERREQECLSCSWLGRFQENSL